MSEDAKARRAILIHGFNVRDEGNSTVGTLVPYLQAAGFHVKRPRYGWRGLLGVRYLNDTFSQLIADLSEPGDTLIGHSNGCAIAVQAVEKTEHEFDRLVLINPALDSDYLFPSNVRRIDVWHSPSDAPVRFAKLLPWHSWGDMGAVGYRGLYDPRVRSFNKENGFEVSSSSHSDVFAPGKVEFFAPIIVSKFA
jgi:pimeloyl-ACP methyl ester carboxylesterase